MSKAQEFINALRALCRDHRVSLRAHSRIYVDPLDADDDELCCDGIDDMIEFEAVE